MRSDLSREGRRHTSPPVATFLSFLWPGAGQWYLGRRRAALIYALPVVAVAVAAVLQLLGGLTDLAIQLFAPTYSLTILILIVLMGLWRLLSMADTLSAAGRRSFPRGRPFATFAALALVVIVVHAAAGYVAWSFYDAGTKVFVGNNGQDFSPAPDNASGEPGLVATPISTPSSPQARINVLLTGIDSSATRNHALTDTLIVVSIDPVTKHVEMLSFPRDIANFPLWNGKTFTGKINSLMPYAQAHPAEFPDGPLPSLIKELSYLVGVPIHYYAAVNLDGFRLLIDKVGGVDIDNPKAINDPVYGGWTDKRPIGFYLTAGRHHLDGQSALAYVRSRKGPGDNDFTRARRQQQLLVALARKLADPTMLLQLPKILPAAGQTIRTNFPADRLGEMLALSRAVPDNLISRFVLGPPYAVRPLNAIATYYLQIDFDRLAKLSIQLFGQESRYSAPNGAVVPSATP